MLLFVIFVGVFGADNTEYCEMLGDPVFPLLSKDGDITIGGAFSIHSQISKPSLSFTDVPEALTCSRYRFMSCLFSCLLVSQQNK